MRKASRLLALLACLMGAAGVAAAAAAAHIAGERLAPAAQLLMVHAAASLALLALFRNPIAVVAVAGMEAGAILFAADMASRVWSSGALFPMAAPAGGTLVILAWLVAALAVIKGM